MSDNESDRQPIIEIVTTSSAEAELDPPEPGQAAQPAASSSFLRRFQLPLMIGAGVLLALLLFGIGLGLGLFVREFNEKQYVDQITLLRGALERNATGWEEARKSLEDAETRQKEVEGERDELKSQLDVVQQALKSALAQISTLTPTPTPRIVPSTDATGARYLRFGNKNCLIRPGQDRVELENCFQEH
ncbi:hypothetical protein [Chitiniphilus eburneus]|uniref:Uncharacterized protein n=1 Tax=Chitiniphilus eburneus TaxID=2571148 RepID=A0A4U0Q1P1_9NEIS|nr:hypothetical protein [Chitiniphilus eburneus]TJZ74829.1 hypothetical protein FAZ21_07685 [Chitiniphilus eburneus]